MTQGRLFGVGTGPGDPLLVTRRAWSLIEKAEVVAYPAPDSGTSFARSIVAEAIRSDAVEIPMVVPMRPGRAPAQAIYDRGAADIALHLEAGRDVVVLCEGDPLFYGSFMYLLVRLADRFDVEIVPGVTSLSACAAAQIRPLVARSDRLTVLPGTLGDADLALLTRAMESLKPRAKTLDEIAEGALFLFETLPLAVDEKAAQVLRDAPEGVLASVTEKLRGALRLCHRPVRGGLRKVRGPRPAHTHNLNR